MTENGKATKELTPKQNRALVALLSATTIGEAAEQAGVGDRTLRRWLHNDEAFREAYREQRRSALEAVAGLLESSMFEAIEVLRQAMRDGNLNHRIRAAGMILEHGLRSLQFEHVELREQEELIRRLEALEEAQLEDEKPWGV